MFYFSDDGHPGRRIRHVLRPCAYILHVYHAHNIGLLLCATYDLSTAEWVYAATVVCGWLYTYTFVDLPAHIAAVAQAEEARDAARVPRTRRQLTCLVCLEDLGARGDATVIKDHGHGVCKACFVAWMYESQSGRGDLIDRLVGPGHFQCPQENCPMYFPVARIMDALRLDDESTNAYMALVIKHTETRTLREENAVRETADEEASGPRSATLATYVRRIENEVLCNQCPTCNQVFSDFDGCTAISCKCGTIFCGLCLKRSASDRIAHRVHPASCRYNPTTSVWAKDDIIQDAVRRRRQDRLEQYMRDINVEDETRRQLVDRIQKHCFDLGVNALAASKMP